MKNAKKLREDHKKGSEKLSIGVLGGLTKVLGVLGRSHENLGGSLRSLWGEKVIKSSEKTSGIDPGRDKRGSLSFSTLEMLFFIIVEGILRSSIDID